jgi:hypothetical protein
MRWDRILQSVRAMGLERTRRALALLPLAVFVLLYGMLALLLDPSWRPAFVGLAFCYLIGFVSLGAEWFWARWYCTGLAWSGLMVGVFGMVSVGLVPPLVIYTTMHGAIVLLLRGKTLSALYEGQTAWRTRFELDEHGVSRVGSAVSRTSASLPALIMWALGPKQPEQLVTTTISSHVFGQWAAAVALVLCLWSLVSLLRGRALGALLLTAATSVTLAALPLSVSTSGCTSQAGLDCLFAGAVIAAPIALMAANLPFIGPLQRYLRGR